MGTEFNFWKLVKSVTIKLAWGALVFVAVVTVFYTLLKPFFTGETMEGYIRIFLLLTLVNTFASLRLYNSQVANTRFLLKVREAVSKLLPQFVTLEKGIRNLDSTVKRSISGTPDYSPLKKAVEDLDTTIRRLDSIGKDGK